MWMVMSTRPDISIVVRSVAKYRSDTKAIQCKSATFFRSRGGTSAEYVGLGGAVKELALRYLCFRVRECNASLFLTIARAPCNSR